MVRTSHDRYPITMLPTLVILTVGAAEAAETHWGTLRCGPPFPDQGAQRLLWEYTEQLSFLTMVAQHHARWRTHVLTSAQAHDLDTLWGALITATIRTRDLITMLCYHGAYGALAPTPPTLD